MAEYDQFLGLLHCSAVARCQLLCRRRIHWSRLDVVPATGDSAGHTWFGGRDSVDAGLPRGVYHRFHHGRPELRGDYPAGQNSRYDTDAHAAHDMGHFCRDCPRAVRLPGALCERDHDVTGCATGHQLLHAGDHDHGKRGGACRRQSAVVPAPVLVLWSPRGLHCCAACVWHCV